MKNHHHQSDAEFLTGCKLPDTRDAQKVALAVRSAIARLGEIPPALISADDCFENLDWTPFWKKCGDAGFDTESLVRELEVHLEHKFSKSQLKQIRDPDLDIQMKISDFIGDIWRCLKSD